MCAEEHCLSICPLTFTETGLIQILLNSASFISTMIRLLIMYCFGCKTGSSCSLHPA